MGTCHPLLLRSVDPGSPNSGLGAGGGGRRCVRSCTDSLRSLLPLEGSGGSAKLYLVGTPEQNLHYVNWHVLILPRLMLRYLATLFWSSSGFRVNTQLKLFLAAIGLGKYCSGAQ